MQKFSWLRKKKRHFLGSGVGLPPGYSTDNDHPETGIPSCRKGDWWLVWGASSGESFLEVPDVSSLAFPSPQIRVPPEVLLVVLPDCAR